MKKAIINLETLACPSCLQKIESAVKGLNGIEKDSEDLGYPVIRSRVRSA